MDVRVKLAVIDHNHHLHRQALTGQDGEIKWKRKFGNKSRRWTVCMDKVPKDYAYNGYLLASVVTLKVRDRDWLKRSLGMRPDDPRTIAPSIATVMGYSTVS